MVPQFAAFTGVQQNGKFTARRIVGLTGGCPNAAAQHGGSHSRCLQIVGRPFFNWHAQRARLTHDARGRRIFRTVRRLRRCRTAGKKGDTRYGGDQANGAYCVARLHKLYSLTSIIRDVDELSYRTLGLCRRSFSCDTTREIRACTEKNMVFELITRVRSRVVLFRARIK